MKTENIMNQKEARFKAFKIREIFYNLKILIKNLEVEKDENINDKPLLDKIIKSLEVIKKSIKVDIKLVKSIRVAKTKLEEIEAITTLEQFLTLLEKLTLNEVKKKNIEKKINDLTKQINELLNYEEKLLK